MQIGTPKELLFNPANEFSKQFLDGHRLALEFKVIRIKDLWSNLPDGNHNVGTKGLNPEQSVWEAMESLSAEPLSVLKFSDEKGAVKIATFNDLTKAFNHFKKLPIHE